MIYLDYQATTPLAPEAREAMLPWLDGPESAGLRQSPQPARVRAARLPRRWKWRASRSRRCCLPVAAWCLPARRTEALNLAIFGSAPHARSQFRR
jgi:cysteine desulfurase